MRWFCSILVLPLLPVTDLCGNSAGEVIIALMRLSEEPNYSWHSTMADDARVYVIDGRTQANGYSWVRLPMVEELAWRLARSHPRRIEAIFYGSSDCVIRAAAGWSTLRELPSRHEDWDNRHIRPEIPRRKGADPQAYSNAQFALKRPHEELAVIASSFVSIDPKDATATGTLSELGAQLLLVSDNVERVEPSAARGRFEIWFTDGRVTKYRTELEGILYVAGKPRHVHQSSVTIIHDIGTSAFAVPPEVSQQLEVR